MKKIFGISVSNGIGIGKAKIIKEDDILVSEHHIQDTEINENIRIFKHSIENVIKEIDIFINNFQLLGDDLNIIETHKMILLDPVFHDSIEKLIKDEKRNIEHAIKLHFDKTIDYFKNLDVELYADRAIDYEDVYKRLVRYIKKTDNNELNEINTGEIVVIEDIPPSWISVLHKKKIEGIVLLKGTKTSHSVIIARALGIPIVTGIKSSHKIYSDCTLIIDAAEGCIISNPSEEDIDFYTHKKNDIDNKTLELSKFKDIAAKSEDCDTVLLLSNIELPEEIEQVLDLNTDGIGLFRTEYLYLNRQNLPSEEEQFQEYKMIAEKLGSKVFTIRTIDIGGDKVAGWYTPSKEANPYLGCRGIRFSLKHINIFKTQIRAILRASIYGNIQIMFPMISSIEEFLQAKNIVKLCMTELKSEKIEFNENIKIGTMIEVPSAALNSDILAKHSDFLSIGTNDLLQYVVAVDRNNEHVESYYCPYVPAFLKLIAKTVKSAKKNNKPVAICGELANDMNFTTFLLCIGVRELSMGNQHILNLKKHIRSINIQSGLPFLKDLLRCYTIEGVKKWINRLNNVACAVQDLLHFK